MDETILFPSPNWFQVSGLAVSNDGWLAYGGPSKSLCVLEPLPADYNGVIEGSPRYRAHVLNRAHPDKIVSVDISPEWPEKRYLLTGSAGGSVKQWSVEQADQMVTLKSVLSHDVHTQEKEDVVGVAYSDEVCGVTVGSFGNIVKWDLNANVVRTFTNLLKNFKPSSMACSHHVPLHVAIGTKQGVLFVVDLTGPGSILYKVRSHDDEIMNVSWCPHFEVKVEKTLDLSIKSGASGSPNENKPKKFSVSDRLEKIRQQKDPEESNVSGVIKNLPEDSFDSFEVVQEDDIFDIYKDHEADEFGHKKYEPEDILVKIKEPEKEIDYLVECLEVKEAILNKKTESEATIESLVEKLDKTDINSKGNVEEAVPSSSKEQENVEPTSTSSVHLHKHLLASIGKHGGIRIWSKAGKLVSSCAVSSGGKNHQGRHKSTSWATLTWCKPDLLLVVDGKNQLLECNPLKIDCKNKLETSVLHSVHKRGLHCVASNAARGASPAAAVAWTAAQDRTLACYSLHDRTTTIYNTCGGFIYNIQMCPYDANKVAISVGDGAVRVWSAEESETEGKLLAGRVAAYWQHVQGKVLTVAWHPTREDMLAFGTAESRVGLIDASGAGERAARALPAALAGGVYSLCWADRLYAVAKGDLVAYAPDRPDEPPKPVAVSLEGAAWAVSAARARGPLLAAGSDAGGVAVLAGGAVLAAAFPFSKIIHTIEWHPTQISSSNEESPYKNLMAVCSQDKANTVVILEFGEKEDGVNSLHNWKTLTGHTGSVLQLAWNPHRDATLLSTSIDGTVRVWDGLSGTCSSIFGGHGATALGAAWSARPALAHAVLSGGADCCLRLWDARAHPAGAYCELKPEVPKKDKKKKNNKERRQNAAEATEETENPVDPTVAAMALDSKIRARKKFLLPTITRQMGHSRIRGAKKLLHMYLVRRGIEEPNYVREYDLDYVMMFGNSNEVNTVFELEMRHHEELDNTEQWVVLSVFRGHIDAMIQYASERNALCPFLLSIAPSVSSKYWKDTAKLYLSQIDRLVATGEEEKLVAARQYGGPVFRKVVVQLSLLDVKGAVTTLCEANLFKEAYLLCRIRFIDSIADEVLSAWAKKSIQSGVYDTAALCFVALGNLLEAATILGKCGDEASLSLAAALARAAGQTILSDNLAERNIRGPARAEVNLEPDQLPSRIELLMRDFVNAGRDDTPKEIGDGDN